ncbi:MAG: Maf family protein [Clostridia bacterium]|nr:Maf family protein [Clostridia bacterium]MDD4047444.1 Maf family protein [Clostridia bacterium]
MDVVLASGSPRRANILSQMGVSYRVVNSQMKEDKPSNPYCVWVQDLAYQKARTVASSTGEIILAADTVVVRKEDVLGKPIDKTEAKKMLSLLSGDVHEVMTGICVINAITGQVFKDVEITKVYFRILTEQEIEKYIQSEEPFDKAGAYGIQGLGGLLVEKIEGCYYNVMGLPMVKTMNLFRKCGIKILGG